MVLTLFGEPSGQLVKQGKACLLLAFSKAGAMLRHSFVAVNVSNRYFGLSLTKASMSAKLM